jgi:DNA-binding transcriptional regulator YiaG
MEGFKRFVMDENDDVCMDCKEKSIYTNEKLLEIIQSISDINKLRLMNIQDRSKVIKEIRDKTEASNRQLSRVLNIGRGILDRIK